MVENRVKVRYYMGSLIVVENAGFQQNDHLIAGLCHWSCLTLLVHVKQFKIYNS